MMGRQSGQISMLILDIEELIPENHLLRKINQMISFDFTLPMQMFIWIGCVIWIILRRKVHALL